MGQYLLGIDVGGTFTDFVLYDTAGRSLRAWKNLTEANDPTAGMLTGLAQLDAPHAVGHLRLGTTVATNAILERKGARTAYVATAGFRDIPFLQRGNRANHYDSGWIKPRPLVLRRDSFEVNERIAADGSVVAPLDEAAVTALGEEIRRADGIEAVAVNLLFSYVEPGHERRVREILEKVLGDVPVSISSDVMPKWKEYERATTVLADAYIKPVVHRYLHDMGARLEAAGIAARPALIKSNGGEMTLEEAGRQPVHLTLSGPTGGVVAAGASARLLGLDHLVTLDMGGTSTDCSTIVDGVISFTTNFEIEFGIPIQVPMIDIRTIGAGGGSIAWVDRGGMLRVGPQSAGARPGPACYGFGGEAATVTDANLVLGRISAEQFLGGGMKLDYDAAAQALSVLAAELGMTVPETALAIVRIVNNNMVGALRTVLIERGLDPRDFSLLAFGGAGPLHVADLVEEAGLAGGVVPLYPGQFSALGFIFSDARVDLERTVQMNSSAFDCERANSVMAEMLAVAETNLRRQGYSEALDITTSLELRYLGQNYELELPFTVATFSADTVTSVWADFHALHESRFGFAIPGEVIEVITLKCTAVARGSPPELAALPAAPAAAAASERDVWFEHGAVSTPVYQRDTLVAAQTIAGPALIEEAASVTVVRPGQLLRVSSEGFMQIEPVANAAGQAEK